MKTARIQSAIKKYLHPLLENYKMSGDVLYKIDDDYLLKGYYFEGSDFDKDTLAVWYFVQPLFVPKEHLVLTFGERLKHNKKMEWWKVSKENEASAFNQILEAIQHTGEKFLGKITSVNDFYKYFQSMRKDNIRIYEAIAFATVLLNDEKLQQNKLEDLADFSTRKLFKDIEWVTDIRNNANSLLNKSGIERLETIKKWKSETLSHLKLN